MLTGSARDFCGAYNMPPSGISWKILRNFLKHYIISQMSYLFVLMLFTSLNLEIKNIFYNKYIIKFTNLPIPTVAYIGMPRPSFTTTSVIIVTCLITSSTRRVCKIVYVFL